MPYRVIKGNGTRKWKIINEDTNLIVGTSLTKTDALASVRARYAHENNTMPHTAPIIAAPVRPEPAPVVQVHESINPRWANTLRPITKRPKIKTTPRRRHTSRNLGAGIIETNKRRHLKLT